METSRPHTQEWRTYLGQLAATPREKQRVANALGVRRFSITRWITGEVTPRPYHLQKLPNLFPQEGAKLKALIEKDHPGIFPPSSTSQNKQLVEDLTNIPSSYYERLLSALADIEASLSPWTIALMGTQQFLAMIDKDRLGTTIALLRCTQPAADGDGMVRSLHELVHGENVSLKSPLHLTLFGKSCLSGKAVTLDCTQIAAYEIAVPLRRRRRIAGCLLISSYEPITEVIQEITERYANLFSLLFTDVEFYDVHSIVLQEFPSQESQQALIDDQLGAQRRVGYPLLSLSPQHPYQQREALLLALQGEEHHG
jgi:hypothetical protein